MRASLSEFWRKLRNLDFRHGFVAAELKQGVALQIRALRLSRGLSQGGLATLCGLTQGAISRAENPNYGNLTFNNVLRIARGLDIAFVGRFVSFREFERLTNDLNHENKFEVSSFDAQDTEAPSDDASSTPHASVVVRWPKGARRDIVHTQLGGSSGLSRSGRVFSGGGPVRKQQRVARLGA